VLSIHNKDSRTVLTWFGGAARRSEQVDGSLYSFFPFDADEQRHVASTQEAAGAGYTGDAVVVSNQLVNHARIVDIPHNGNDHLHFGFLSELLKALDIEHKDRRAAYLGFNHHGLSFEDGRLGMGGDELSAGVTAVANVLQQTWQAYPIEANQQGNGRLVQDAASAVYLGDMKFTAN
jgi:hypothetical protein